VGHTCSPCYSGGRSNGIPSTQELEASPNSKNKTKKSKGKKKVAPDSWYPCVKLIHRNESPGLNSELQAARGSAVSRGTANMVQKVIRHLAELDVLAHACNPSYAGGRDQEDHGSRQKVSKTPSQSTGQAGLV
jgi:hypothetical protein